MKLKKLPEQSSTLMEQTMRWFGPDDPVSLADLRQAGCSGIVSALHHVPNGAIWSLKDISTHKELIETEGLHWSVVESLPVHEHIKRQTTGFEELVENYRQSLCNLATCGIKTITYNFMPLLDWTRTNLNFVMPDGGTTLRFDMIDVAAYDIHILKRPGAKHDYNKEVLALVANKMSTLDDDEIQVLETTMVKGLPGSEETFSTQEFLQEIMCYSDIDAQVYRQNLVNFLQQICPLADELGIRLVIHPDDPPFPFFGLPRVVSTADDLDALFEAVPNRSNGLCFCAGSFSIRPDNDLVNMVQRFAERIHFIHLRNTRRESNGSFFEAPHLDGSIDMFALVRTIVEVSRKRGVSIPMRPDHGHRILNDLRRPCNPGYSAIGRLKGLAELRGLELGISRSDCT